MSYRGHPARGRSSLGYLFGSDDTTPVPQPLPRKNILPLLPPYGTDADTLTVTVSHNKPRKPAASPPFATQDSEKCLANSRSTKIRSSPGGRSSLGYLFGDNN
ncbi:hypothetical protein HN51_068890 [Arachis hypogaea]|uniref:Protein SPIRAL1-like n=2 Tax=Arachis TaxID=3817 RepID=A0A444Z8K5_ARAHY|nr:protein SPIRAL1-like 5 [Arachis duranensis]XP_016200677.1 protein SPIRAL1-like 5 [Arachis ipaensis]XP_025653808.1 protein SPIRAL1-like 5 [Arachis hypogaea]XP_025699976.1 protein SPIRAL1-like 5 [Arachis hypogaea]XP_057762997.1 protein SPIRAL1-like 5 [Arachis stenosperma]QHO11039.1 Protein SPIRAL1-like [Arachis hypogaea]QHO41963.1 Protein SPIRAL1-like [Arachis hypogaea]RYR10491.1 hypothetical protein Ahy_B05g078922 [Arachis hypogaea]RYR58772.1 hypothetical protein Ahy_A05g024651 [Arachis h